MKRLIALVLASVVVGAGVFLFTRKVASQQENRKAFTAFLVMSFYKDDVESHKNEFVLYAQRGDGSHVRATNRFGEVGQRWGVMKHIVDLRSRVEVGTDPWTDSKSTMPLSPGLLKFHSAPPLPPGCTKDPQAPHETILGYDTVKVIDQFGSEQALRAERWLAPALECFPLREVAKVGSLVGNEFVPKSRQETQVVWVAEGEPSESLFDVPKGYVERKPSEIDAEWYRMTGQHITPTTRLPGLDQRYERAQQNR